jgi:Fic family protein
MESKLYELDAKMDAVRTKMASYPERVVKDYKDRLDVSWIYHEHALEGVVLSYSELKASLDTRIISDVSLIPMYEEVKNHKAAVDFIREAVTAKKPPVVDVEFIRKLYGMLTPDQVAKGCPYRKENPLHRLYYHEIAPPEKIVPKMKKLDEWLASDEFKDLHPVAQTAKLQWRLLSAYPWTKNTGKVARLVGNYILLRAGYLPAVVHSIERQRYYESLRHENDSLLQLLVESLDNAIETTSKFFDELAGLKTTLRRAS